jgi:hypothetical protein
VLNVYIITASLVSDDKVAASLVVSIESPPSLHNDNTDKHSRKPLHQPTEQGTGQASRRLSACLCQMHLDQRRVAHTVLLPVHTLVLVTHAFSHYTSNQLYCNERDFTFSERKSARNGRYWL